MTVYGPSRERGETFDLWDIWDRKVPESGGEYIHTKLYGDGRIQSLKHDASLKRKCVAQEINIASGNQCNILQKVIQLTHIHILTIIWILYCMDSLIHKPTHCR